MAAGTDIEMPGSGGHNDRKLVAAVRTGVLDERVLERAATRAVSLSLAGTAAAAQDAAQDASMAAGSATATDGAKGATEAGGGGDSTGRGRCSGPQSTREPAAATAGLAALLAANHAFARRAATESAVLLRNRVPSEAAPCVLPLVAAELSSVAIIGSFAKAPRFQGAGSSCINAHTVDAPFDAIQTLLREEASAAAADGLASASARRPAAQIRYAAGYETRRCSLDGKPHIDHAAVAEAAAAAAAADVAIVFVGLPSAYEAEGVDRRHLRMPSQMDGVVSAVAKANARTVVVLMGGAPMELPTLNEVPAILYVGLSGQAVGGAVADLLFGRAGPAGRLGETWPLSLEDVPSQRHFATHPRQVVYREGLNVGYRYFTTHRVPVAFPFGHGLSYTTFRYSGYVLAQTRAAAQTRGTGRVPFGTHAPPPVSEPVCARVRVCVRACARSLQLSAHSLSADELRRDGVRVTLTVTNTGGSTGREVVQLYVRDVSASVYRPDRELAAFSKSRALPPGQSETVTLQLDARAFSFYRVDTASTASADGAASAASTGGAAGAASAAGAAGAGATVVGKSRPIGWTIETGEFTLLVGSSCVDIRASAAMHVTPAAGDASGDVSGGVGVSGGVSGAGDGVAASYVTLDDDALARLGLHVPAPEEPACVHRLSTFEEISRTSHIGWLVVQLMTLGARRAAGIASGLGDAEAAVSVAVYGLHGSSLHSLQLMTYGGHRGWFSDAVVDWCVHVLNGRFLSALARCVEAFRGRSA